MKFSIITPSYNQGAYIERTLRSILAQGAEVEVESIVMDGGSTDGTLDVLRRFDGQVRWTSARDAGQSDAINRGLQGATGDMLAWLNSDDVYEPGALAAVARAYERQPFQWAFGNCRVIDENDREIRRAVTAYKLREARRYSYRRLLRRDFIAQPAAFFTREAFERVGPLDLGLNYSMDYDYWLRLGRVWEPCYIDRLLAGFRWHSRSKNGAAYRAAALESLGTARRHARRGEAADVFMHRIHVLLLFLVYRIME